MSNPYQSPSYNPNQFKDQPAYMPPPGNSSGMVQAVRIVAILNAVQGGLEILMSLMYVAMSAFFPVMAQIQANNPNGRGPGNEPPKEFFWVIGIVYGGIGLVMLVGGILRIVACLQNFKYKGRTLGFVSFGVGMVSLITCYCAPTAIGMLIFGLIVYLNPAVAAAFKMGQEGLSSDQIVAAFSPYPYGYPPGNYPSPPFPSPGAPK
jgi:hypothetical protein